jgi:HNH endonuclease
MRKTVILKGMRYNKYEVDDKGNIYRKGSDTPLKKFGDGRGYLRVDLMNDKSEKVMAKIHLVVMHTFKGKQKPGYIINHIDGDKTNSSLGNLEYISQRENVAHAQRLIKNLPYLEEDTINNIIELRNDGLTLNEIADELGLKYHVVRDMLQGRTYNYVKR